MRSNQWKVIPLFMLILIDTVGVGIIFPIISPLIMSPQSNMLAPHTSQLVKYVYLGVALTAFPLTLFPTSILLGSLSDRLGRKPLLMFCLVLALISYLLSAFSIYIHNYWLFVVTRILAGISGGSVAVAQAAVIELSEKHNKTQYVSYIALAFSIGFIIGPVVGGTSSIIHLPSGENYMIPFLIVALATITNIAILKWFYHPPKKELSSQLKRIENPLTHILASFRLPNIGFLAFIYFMMQSVLGLYYVALIVLMNKHFHLLPGEVGLIFAIGGLCALLATLYMRKITRMFKPVTNVILTMVVFIIAMLILVIVETKYIVWVSNALLLKIL